jgi:hypothetical protein
VVKRKVSITIDDEVFRSFRDFCRQNGMKISSKVELFMKDSVKNTSLKKFLE